LWKTLVGAFDLRFQKIFLQGLLQVNFLKIFSLNLKKCLTWNLKHISLLAIDEKLWTIKIDFEKYANEL